MTEVVFNDSSAEECVLKYLMTNPDTYPGITEDFFEKERVAIFKQITQFHKEVSKDELLLANPSLDKACLERIASQTESGDPEYWFNRLGKTYFLRRLLSTNPRILEKFAKRQVYTDGSSVWFWKEGWEEKSFNELVSYAEKHDTFYQDLKSMSGYCVNFVDPDNLPHANDPVEWLIDGILRKRSFNEVVGPAKSGKSQFAYQISFCIQNGVEFLGYEATKHDVLYVDYELEDNEIKQRKDNLLLKYDPSGEKGYTSYKVAGLCKDATSTLSGVLAKVRQEKKNNPNIQLVVFDNFYSFCEGDTNNLTDVRDVLREIKKGVGEDMTVIVVNHTNKADAKGGNGVDPLYSAAGSAAHGNYVDEMFYIDSHSNGTKIKVKGRHVSPTITLECTNNEDTYWFFDKNASSTEVKKTITASELEAAYPEICTCIKEQSIDGYGVSLDKIMFLFQEIKGVSDIKNKGFIYTGKNKRDDGIPCGRVMLPPN